MQLTIRIDSKEVEALLTRAPAALDRALGEAMNDAVADLHVQMSTYPTQRHGSTYERTNTLKRSWMKEVRKRGGAWTGKVESANRTAPYNIRVQSGIYQARVHRGIWTNTDTEVIERSEQRINGYFQRRIRSVVARL